MHRGDFFRHNEKSSTSKEEIRALPMDTSLRILRAVGVTALLAVPAYSQTQDPPPVSASAITDDLYMVTGGRGANSAFLVGEEGVLLVDSKLDAGSAEAMLAAIRDVSGGDIAYLINTHVHIDHTGGNPLFGRLGAQIVAHENVRSILSAGQRGGSPAPPEALPTVVFSDGEGTEIPFGDEIVRIDHIPPAHTTDNCIVEFVNANVFVLGDLYSPSRYPVIAGGTFEGFIEGVESVLERSDADSRFVPGVGEITGRAELEAYLEMLAAVRARVRALIDDGGALEDVIAAAPTAGFNDTWGAPDHRLFLPVAYRQLSEWSEAE